MPKDARPVLSVAVRRFDREFEASITDLLTRLQEAAARQPGYLGEQNSLSHAETYSELVTVFAFDSRENLEKWESSGPRKDLLAELDRHPHESSKHSGFDDFSVLLHPKSRVSRVEIVLILIFWIMLLGWVLGGLAGLLLPAGVPPFLRSLLPISINVVLISYIFLPWSSRLLTRLKARLSR